MNFKKIGLLFVATAMTMTPLLSTANAEDNSVGLRVSAVLPEKINDQTIFHILIC